MARGGGPQTIVPSVYAPTMANYGYVATKLAPSETGGLLREVVAARFGGRIAVTEHADWLPEYPGAQRLWLVHAPGTALHDEKEAMMRMVAPGDDFGFVVTFEGGSFAFRHSINDFDRWLCGSVEHSLAKRLATTVFYDATDVNEPVREYMLRGGYLAYLNHVYEGLHETVQRRLDLMPPAWDDRPLDQIGMP